jgi:hypothetical protein
MVNINCLVFTWISALEQIGDPDLVSANFKRVQIVILKGLATYCGWSERDSLIFSPRRVFSYEHDGHWNGDFLRRKWFDCRPFPELAGIAASYQLSQQIVVHTSMSIFEPPSQFSPRHSICEIDEGSSDDKF